MRSWSVVIASAVASIAAPSAAQQQDGISIEPGDEIVIRLDGEGMIQGAPARGRAEWTPYDLFVARHFANETPPDTPQPYASPAPTAPKQSEPPPVEPGLIRLRFHSVAGRHSLLILENGYGLGLAYRARMRRDGRDGPTDVCIVIPHRRGFEHWPHPIERLELSHFQFVLWRDGDPAPCA